MTKHTTSDLFRHENNRAGLDALPQGARYIPVCTQCGSADVIADAAARWSVDAQAWELVDTHDNMTCEHCDGECRTLDVLWDDADAIESFLRRAWEHTTEPAERPTFAAFLDAEAVAHVDEDDNSPRLVLAQRLYALRNPPARDVTWEFVRVGAPGPTSATYYCAADPLQAMELIEAKAVADYLGPQWAAIRDDDGDWVFAGPFRSEGFTVSREHAMSHVHKALRS